MFGIDTSEFLLIGVVALIVIGPKDLPKLMRVLGQWIGKARRLSSHVRAGVDEMIRQAEATAADAIPVGKRPTSPAQLATMLLTPDTRSKEPGGERSTLAPLYPGPLARSLTAPLTETTALVAAHAPADPSQSGEHPDDQAPGVPTILVTRDTRTREPGGAESTVVPLRPGALAASFALPDETSAPAPEGAVAFDNQLDERQREDEDWASKRASLAA